MPSGRQWVLDPEQARQAAEQVRLRRQEELAQREPEARQHVMTLIEQS